MEYIYNNHIQTDSSGNINNKEFTCTPASRVSGCHEDEKFDKCMYGIDTMKYYSKAPPLILNNTHEKPRDFILVNTNGYDMVVTVWESYIFDLFHCVYNLGNTGPNDNDYGWGFIGDYYALLDTCGQTTMGCPPDGYVYDLIKKIRNNP